MSRKHGGARGRKFIAHDIRGCGRCGRNHRKLVARMFRRPPNGGWDAWAMCPRTGEPLLLDTGGKPDDKSVPYMLVPKDGGKS